METLTEDSILSGERLYEAALDLVIASAERKLLIFDQDMTSGAYASLKRYEMLYNFLGQKHGKLTIVLHDTYQFTHQLPRLHSLLQTYGHLIQVLETNDSAKVAKDCFVIADQRAYVRRFHIDQARFRYKLEDPETVSMLNMRFNELLEATSHQVTITTLGL